MQAELSEAVKKINLQARLCEKLEYSNKLKDQSIDNYKAIDELNKNIIYQKDREIVKYKNSAKGWMIGGISVSVVALIVLIAK